MIATCYFCKKPLPEMDQGKPISSPVIEESIPEKKKRIVHVPTCHACFQTKVGAVIVGWVNADGIVEVEPKKNQRKKRQVEALPLDGTLGKMTKWELG